MGLRVGPHQRAGQKNPAVDPGKAQAFRGAGQLRQHWVPRGGPGHRRRAISYGWEKGWNRGRAIGPVPARSSADTGVWAGRRMPPLMVTLKPMSTAKLARSLSMPPKMTRNRKILAMK